MDKKFREETARMVMLELIKKIQINFYSAEQIPHMEIKVNSVARGAVYYADALIKCLKEKRDA